ncbi:hypothetical protein CROQUDRAFT_43249 [Cronartium quercuum f. sp. fusiforme G11]|uniref:ABC transporter domain-containing protein n=1 Tax=Cronartium quercuum f. sp. fusiforme G11 TaxID=708437 RepID=A0A9P6TCV3_9BASI|nr:hypothetical protein CROQUDRAFT_43249 [Cronartium quercuum f. sp. fusiforme G11]
MFFIANRRLFCSLLFVCLSAKFIYAQTCQSFNQTNSSCTCPPGTTNSPNCGTLACGNPFIASSKRPALNPTAAGDSGGKGCQNQCTGGFAGVGCNICRNADACKSGLTSLSAGSTSSSGLASSAFQDVTCNTSPIGFGVGFGECSGTIPALAAFYPGKFWGVIQQNPDPSSASLPSSLISQLTPGTTLNQIWYSPNSSTVPEQQFYCEGTNCTQKISHNMSLSQCTDLKCRCLSGSTLCGGGTGINFKAAIDNFKGYLKLECPLANTTSMTCKLKNEAILQVFGPDGLEIPNCLFGECIQKSLADTKRQLLYNQVSDEDRLSTGVALGIGFVSLIILALLSLVLFGFYQQHQARHPRQPSSNLDSNGAARLVWKDLRYVLSSKGSRSVYRRLRSFPHRKAGMSESYSLQLPVNSVSSHPHPHADVKLSGHVGLDSPVPILPAQYDHHQPKQILRGLSGSVEPGTMMAILGPSGAGKSTFLDILAGQRKAGKITGSHSITIPDQEGTSGNGITIGFVDQSDIVSATSTVREALTFAAALKLPEDVSNKTRQERVSEVMDLLGLSHVANSKIGNDEVRGLSGGERRRVSIGLELIAKPSILFLDEPTSGLDSVSALRVINVLKGLSTNALPGCGTTIVCSIHQPSSQIYAAFDYICLLAPGGRQVYCGKMEEATNFIASHGLHCPPGYNMADYLLEVASDPPESLMKPTCESEKSLESYPASIQSTPISYLSKTQPRTTVMTQFQCLAGRDWMNLKRDPTLFWMHAAVAVVTGIFVGAMYFQAKLTVAGFQNRIGSMFFLGAILSFSALSALNNLLHARLLFMRERAGKYYTPAAWLLSRLFFDLIPLRIFPALVMGLIIYYMVGLNHQSENVLKFTLVLLQLTTVQTLFNFFLAAVFTHGSLATLLSSLINLIQMAFAGFFVNLSTMTSILKWVQYLAPFKFALEAMTVNEVGSGLMIKDNLEGVNIQVSASMIMDLLFGFKPDSYGRDVLALFGFLGVFTALLVVTVYLKLKQTR